MEVKKIINPKTQRLSKLLGLELGLVFGDVQKIIRKKDVKIQGKRVSKDIDVEQGEVVEVYFKQEKQKIFFETEDVVVCFKPRGVETVSDTKDDFKSRVEKDLNREIFAVHRLDRNTEGLVIFAKNVQAKNSLDRAIKLRKLQKFYLAKVVGRAIKDQEKLTAYLKKDSVNSLVYISDLKQDGYEKIQTNYKVLERNEGFSILEVELVTGKTHQIRAHLSHIGYPILGDEKYGNNVINKKYGKKYQCLVAYKLIFHFDKNDYLFGLNGKAIEVDKNEINFYKNNQ